MTYPKVVSLYSGAGGLDYGFEAAGFHTSVALEFDHDCCETMRRNRSWSIIEKDIFDTPTQDILKAADLKAGDVDVLIGGPPCQPFSKAAYWAAGDTKRLEDPRADTLSAYMRVVKEALPKVFLLENVQGLVFSSKDEGFQLLLKKIESINRATGSKYKPFFKVVNAAEYGVPQLRERFILVASRDGSEFKFPVPTHGDAQSADGLLPYKTSWDAMGDLEKNPAEDLKMRGKWGSLLPSIPEGQNYLWHTNRGGGVPLFGWRSRFWQFMLKLAKNKPSWTIPAQPGPSTGPFHWESRRLSIRELCRLQTFPDNVEIFGGRTSQQKQLGNAVPSLLGEVLARSIGEQFFGMQFSSGLELLPKVRTPIPDPEPVSKIPKEFKNLIGDHDDHPGTGKGKGALARKKAALEIQE